MKTIRTPALSMLAMLAITCAAAPAAWPDDDTLLEKVLAGSQRSAENKARDVDRHPGETLRFFGLRPDMTVVEILPGRGWYNEILAPYLQDRGRLIAASYGADHPIEALRNYHIGYIEKLDAEPWLYRQVERVVFQTDPMLRDVPDNSVDMVLDFRNTHNLIRWGAITEQAYRAYYRVLKPGGILGVIDHRAAPGADPVVSAETGYVPESFSIELAGRVGFRLAGKSEINANPKDTRDHPNGVWTLPPRLRTGDEAPDRYQSIGESDRMTLKFVK